MGEELNCYPDQQSLRKKAEFQVYPKSLKSEPLEGVLHVVGVFAAILCEVILFMKPRPGDVRVNICTRFSQPCINGNISGFGVYHLSHWHDARPILRQLNHAAIYLKIAGTYTPIVVILDTIFAHLILALVLGLALLGMLLKLFF